MLTTICPTHDELLDYAAGKLSDDASDALASHLDTCPDCQAALATLPDVADTLIARLRSPISSDPYLAEPGYGAAMDRAKAAMQMAESPTELPRPLGEYQLIERLGSGGMGTVFKARQGRLDRIVALKVLSRGRSDDPRAGERFDREMKAIGRLDHPNIVRAHDAREIDGTPVLVMEYVDGLDLAEIVARLGPMSVADACELVRQTALALQCAHEHGLVHRDIKPSNIMLARSGVVKLLDLGLARLFAHNDESSASPSNEEMTGKGLAMGTADYMAPEQVSDSRTVDIRADLYSLGCTLFKLLTGRAPFSGGDYRTALDKMHAHVRQPAPPIRQIMPNLPADLAAIVDRLLAKSASDRFGTPAEVAEALAPLCAGADLNDLIKKALETAPRPQTLARNGAADAKGPQTSSRPPLLLASCGWKWFAGQLALLALAGGIGFGLGIIITVKKNAKETSVEVPDGSRASVAPDGSVRVELPDAEKSAAQASLSRPHTTGKNPPTPQTRPVAPPVVSVIHPIVRPVTDYEDYVGHVEPQKSVSVLNLIHGTVKKIYFKPDALVKKDDVLLEIDPKPFEAEVERVEDLLKQAERQLAENQEGAQTSELRAKRGLEASRLRAEAQRALENGKKNLASTKIKAPDDGKLMYSELHEGDVLLGGQLIATIRVTGRFSVAFNIDERTFLTLQRKADGKNDYMWSLTALCGLPDDKGFPNRGKIESVGGEIDPASGTVRFVAEFPRKDDKLLLLSGMSARVRLLIGPPHKVLLVPEQLVQDDAPRKYVLVVDKNEGGEYVIKRRDVMIGQAEDDGQRVVMQGLSDIDLLLVSQELPGWGPVKENIYVTPKDITPPAPPVVAVSHPIVREVRDYEAYTGQITGGVRFDVLSPINGVVKKAPASDKIGASERNVRRQAPTVKRGELLYEMISQDDYKKIKRAESEALECLREIRMLQSDKKSFGEDFGAWVKSLQDLVKSRQFEVGNNGPVPNTPENTERLKKLALDLKTIREKLERDDHDVKYMQIVSPVSGKIASNVVPGGFSMAVRGINESLSQGQYFVTIESSEEMVARFDISEKTVLQHRRLPNRKPGWELSLPIEWSLADDPNHTYSGKVTAVDDEIDPKTGLQHWHIQLPNKDGILLRGMNVNVRLITGEPRQALLVPRKGPYFAGAEFGFATCLYAVNNQNVVEYRGVTVGELYDGYQEMKTGLTPDDWIITSPVKDNIKLGMVVKPDKQGPTALPVESPSYKTEPKISDGKIAK